MGKLEPRKLWIRILFATLVVVAANVTVLPVMVNLGRWSFWATTATLGAEACLLVWACGLRMRGLLRLRWPGS